MTNRRAEKLLVILFGLAAIGLSAAIPARADTFPSKPITWVVPFGAGGGPDTVARLVANKAGALLGQPIVIENRAGAGGTIGSTYVASARPDGYTLLHGTNGTHGVAPVLYRQLGYDPVKDFVGVTRLTNVNFLLMVPASSPITTLQQFIDDLKSHPDARTFGTSGVGSIPHIVGEAFQSRTGTTFRHIPYRGVPAALNDVLGGRLDFFIDSTTNSYDLVKSGKMRGLAVLTSQRDAFPQEVPTLNSVGIRDFNISGWDAVFVPSGTPAPIVEKLNAAITAALKDPEVQGLLSARGVIPVPTSVSQTAAFLRADLPAWAEATRKSGAQAD